MSASAPFCTVIFLIAAKLDFFKIDLYVSQPPGMDVRSPGGRSVHFVPTARDVMAAVGKPYNIDKKRVFDTFEAVKSKATRLGRRSWVR